MPILRRKCRSPVLVATERDIVAKLLAVLLLLVVPLAASADDCGAPAAATDGWAIAPPEAVGIDMAKLCGLDAFLDQWPERDVHAVLVARHGKLVMERYFSGADARWGTDLGVVRFAPDVMHDVKSVSKSATSLLVGIALAEGKFPDLDSSVLDSFPELAHLSTPEKARITFRHLLTMSSGTTPGRCRRSFRRRSSIAWSCRPLRVFSVAAQATRFFWAATEPAHWSTGKGRSCRS